MSTFKHNKGKLSNGEVEYIAEGFAEDELVEEKDLDFIPQVKVLGDWYDTKIYDRIKEKSRRIIARRKATKEEAIDMKKFFHGLDEFHKLPAKEEGEKLFIALTFDTMMAGGNTDNEKAFFKLGYEAASKEINRLKGLIEMLWKYGELDGSYEEFKIENNIT